MLEQIPMPEFGHWAFLVHIAALTQVIGYLFRDQLKLRILLLTGTIFYLSYYWLYPETPLWDAIFWAVLLGLANLFSIFAIIRDRTRFAMSLREEQLFRTFNDVAPGDFRRLMKAARFREAREETELTRQGVPPEQLCFVLHGEISIEKNGRRFGCPPNSFIGELALITGAPASATVHLAPGSGFVAWERDELLKLTRRRPSMKLALDRTMTHDIAQKLGRS